MELTKGTKIYNHGDMANVEHFGTVTAIRRGYGYEITPDAETGLKPYTIPAYTVSETYSGNGTTRIVTAEAYYAWRRERVSAMAAAMTGKKWK